MNKYANTVEIACNFIQVKRLKIFTQKYMVESLGISQPAYSKIEQCATALKTYRLQQIASTLGFDLITLMLFRRVSDSILGTTNILHIYGL